MADADSGSDNVANLGGRGIETHLVVLVPNHRH
jgi:hypothetical protein